MDPNERFRARRDQTRRTKRRRRAAVLAFLLADRHRRRHGRPLRGRQPGRRDGARPTRRPHPPRRPRRRARPRPLPVEIRGVHVTGALASLSGKFKEYVDYKRYGLNTIELDVKDEGGEIGFATPTSRSRARSARTGSFYNPKALVALAHRNGIYMIGRVVCFQDPTLARERPDLAIQRPDGSVWTTVGRARLGQPLRSARVGLLRVRRAGRRRRRVRPDHVRLRPLPLRRRHQQRRLSGTRRASPRGASSPTSSNTRRGGSSRTVPESRPPSSAFRHHATSASARCLAGSPSTSTACPRCPTPCSTARRARALEPGGTARRDRVSDAHGLPPPGEGVPGPARAMGSGLELPPHRCSHRSLRPGSRGPRGICSGTPPVSTRSRAGPRRRQARGVGRRGTTYGPSLSRRQASLRAGSACDRAAGPAAPARTRPRRRRPDIRPRTPAAALVLAANRLSISATRRSISSRSATAPLCGDAQAPIWLPRGRLAEVGVRLVFVEPLDGTARCGPGGRVAPNTARPRPVGSPRAPPPCGWSDSCRTRSRARHGP